MQMMNIRVQAALIGILVFNLALALALDEGKGRPLAEVLKVTINNIDNDNSGALYGTIKVKDGVLNQFIYSLEKRFAELIRPGENVLLTGPTDQAISASNSFTIDVALSDWNAFKDKSISDGQIAWNIKDTTNKYDVPITREFNGPFGSSTLAYAVWSNAVQATVAVTLINGDEEDPADVYGLLTAGDTKLSSDLQGLLFKRPSRLLTQVRPGKNIPLLRSKLAVSLDSTLTVRADLYDFDVVSPDDEIAKGTATFVPQLAGTSQQTISGRYGQIQVKVTWS